MERSPAHHLRCLSPDRRRVLAAALLAPVCSFAAPRREAADPDGALLRAVIDGPQRNAANRARDPARHPFETLRFFGLAPTQTVVGRWSTADTVLLPLAYAQLRSYEARRAREAADAGPAHRLAA
ncbi:hypothetical protein [Variovorax sp. Sphag1AA]|uniref:hypothetical protein n=1 Tax=Variovorax sp. Sphag1AA TaxID=2587027 RepID=UPI00162094C3|nr:hypothetical protein [Variovorax sp. Sphag1AA]MBB3178235.1 hypothetical protein [Variovorax sp. Sphag1AA]